MKYIILIVILIIILAILALYNSLIRSYNLIKNSKANIDVYLNKRFDLIPNLVECVKGYSNYEKKALEEIIELRNSYNNSKNLNISEIGKLDGKINSFLAVVEAYPELKANEQFLNLQNELSRIETELERERIIFNSVATRYNTKIETVPNNIVAGIFNFKRSELFTTEENKKENISVRI